VSRSSHLDENLVEEEDDDEEEESKSRDSKSAESINPAAQSTPEHCADKPQPECEAQQSLGSHGLFYSLKY